LKDLVFGQAKINDGFNKKTTAYDKALESLNAKFDRLSSALKDQVSLNKMIEDRLDHLIAFIPSIEKAKAVVTRGAKPTRDSPYPNHAGTKRIPKESEDRDDELLGMRESSQARISEEKANKPEFIDTNILPFPHRKATVDERFTCFVDMIQKVHINVPLLEAIRVPTYTCYLSDILIKKRALPTSKVVKHTEEFSTAILNHLLEKKEDPGCPTITCMIGSQRFDHALFDIGASVSVMPKVVLDQLNYTELSPTTIRLQLADSSIRYPPGIAEDIPVKVQDCFIPMDFVVLDMDIGDETPLILGRPFLSTTNAQIDVGAGVIRLHINGWEEMFEFRPRKEQCSMVEDMPWMDTLTQDVESIQSQGGNFITPVKDSRREKPESKFPSKKQYCRGQP
jgi:hypothetical protein